MAFADGEYRPGTLIGDALIAHELAHVVQQGGGPRAGGAQSKNESLSDDSGLEQDADRSAVGAVVAAWTGLKKGLAEVGANALPRLKSGLRLQRCVAVAAAPEVVELAVGAEVIGAETGVGVAAGTGTGLATTAVRVAAVGAVTQVRDEPHTEEQKRTCATAFPEIPICDSLPSGYTFSSVTQALNALKQALGKSNLSLRSPAPATSGPCPGIGTHIGVKDGGTYVASIVCCPCCMDTPSGPVMSTRCRIV